VTETSADGLKREFKIVIPAGELEDQISQRLDQLSKTIRLPGFRPGKVPLPLLRKRYGGAVRGEVLEHALQDSSSEAMREQNLRLALPPRVEIVSAAEGADLEYTMAVEVMPDMPEPDFAALGLERLVVEMPDEDIDRAVERIAEQNRKSEPVERAAANGDLVVTDFVGTINGEEFPGGKGEGITIELGAGRFIPGFEEQLAGASAGDQRTVNVAFPAGYGAQELAGKDASFAVTIREVRGKQPVLAGDELAKEVGLETVDELRQEIRERMGREYAALTRQRLKQSLLDKLAERYDFPVPPGMVDIEFNKIWADYEAERDRRKQAASGREVASDLGQSVAEAIEMAEDSEAQREAVEALNAEIAAPPLDGAAVVAPEETALEGASDTAPTDEDEEKLRAEYRDVAERRVRLGLLLAEVGRNANITVTQDELNQALIREAQRFPGAERQVLDFYRKNPEAANNLRAPIFEEKVVDFVVELAKVGEHRVTPQELLALSTDENEAAPAGA
jgi:trigger factor